MGSIRSATDYPTPIYFTKVLRVIQSFERKYVGITYDILVEPMPDGFGCSYRYIIIDQDQDISKDIPAKENLHTNGSLYSRINRMKKIQMQYTRLLKKSRAVLHKLQKNYNGKSYKLSLLKRTATGDDLGAPEFRNFPTIYLELDEKLDKPSNVSKQVKLSTETGSQETSISDEERDGLGQEETVEQEDDMLEDPVLYERKIRSFTAILIQYLLDSQD